MERADAKGAFLAADRILAPAAAAGAFVCVGISVVATRAAVAHVDPISLAFLRNGIAFLLLFPILRYSTSGAIPIAPKDLVYITVLGLSSFAAFPLLFTAALRFAPASHGALAFPAAAPLFTLLLAAALGRERWSWTKLGGIVLSSLGIAAALIDSGLSNQKSTDTAWLGDTLMVLAAATVAAYNVLTRPFLDRYGTLRLLSVAIGVGAGALALLMSWRLLVGEFHWRELDATERNAILVVGVASALANWLWSWSLSRISPTRVAVFSALNPLVAMFGAVVFLGESFTAALAFGLVMVISGIVVVNWRAAQQK
jgi:drug/metabolite transporter (DMT)-like permease